MNNQYRNKWVPRSNVWGHTSKLNQIQNKENFNFLEQFYPSTFGGKSIVSKEIKGTSQLLPIDIIRMQFQKAIFEAGENLIDNLDIAELDAIIEQSKDFLMQHNSVLPLNKSNEKVIYLVKNYDIQNNTVEGGGVMAINWDLNLYQDSDDQFQYSLMVSCRAVTYEPLSDLYDDFNHLSKSPYLTSIDSLV